MITKITNGRVLIDNEFCDTDIYFDEKEIIWVGGTHDFDCVVDANGCYVTAGWIDIHCHGGGGADFADGDAEGACLAAQTHLRHGTTTLFPTVLSTSPDALEKALAAIEEARKKEQSLAKIHIEGPYLSPSQTGAQNASKLRTPQREEYDRILKKYPVARWDYAPELDGDYAFLSAILKAGAVPSAAHTDASCEQMLDAAEHGCRLITHLYSCTSTVRREKGFRIAGVLEATYLSDDICAELIADGCHLPYSLLRLAYKLKGADRLVLVTDGMRAAGTDTVGECDIGGVPCFIEDGVAKLLDRSAFAGSIATVDRLVRTAHMAGIPLCDCIKMVTKTPARIMGLFKKGEIKAGYSSDIVIFDDNINIEAVYLQGKNRI